MTRGKWAVSPPFTGIVAKDVVAGLLGPRGAQAVARAAVQEAASRGARVRFLQVTPAPAGSSEENNATFAAALRALREYPRVPVTFEGAVGDPGQVLVEHTRDADILVLDAGVPDDVATYCRRHASCDILTVRPTPAACPA